jgi:hypothetical protein
MITPAMMPKTCPILKPGLDMSLFLSYLLKLNCFIIYLVD